MPRFCAVEYRSPGQGSAASLENQIVLVTIQNEHGSLRFFLNPNWKRIVRADDLDYVESFLGDLGRRASVDAGALFKQLSSMEVGPLVTSETGHSLRDYPTITALVEGFREA